MPAPDELKLLDASCNMVRVEEFSFMTAGTLCTPTSGVLVAFASGEKVFSRLQQEVAKRSVKPIWRSKWNLDGLHSGEGWFFPTQNVCMSVPLASLPLYAEKHVRCVAGGKRKGSVLLAGGLLLSPRDHHSGEALLLRRGR